MTGSNKTQAKLEIKLGNLSFNGEGDQEWLTDQLQKLIECAETLSKSNPAISPTNQHQEIAGQSNGGGFQDSLASYLRAKGAERNQVMRFLVAADWLRRRGTELLTSGLVARALIDNQQSRLGNPSDCLNQNVAKGLCEKTNGGFYITPDGLKALGHEAA